MLCTRATYKENGECFEQKRGVGTVLNESKHESIIPRITCA